MSSPLVYSSNNNNKSETATSPTTIKQQQQQLEHPHPHIMIDVLPNNDNNCNDDKTTTIISNGLNTILADKSIACGPSSASSTSGYDDSSDGEDNHPINHTHHNNHNHHHNNHHHHDAFVSSGNRKQQQLASTKVNNDDNDIDSSCSISNLVRDIHLNEVVGICERDPHEHKKRDIQTQLKVNLVSRQLSSNNHNEYLSQAPTTTTTKHNCHEHEQQVDQIDHATTTAAARIQIQPLGLSTFPIDDFDCFEESYRYSDGEKQLRIKMCAVYRLIEIYGWSMGIYNHVTVS